jgi:hypothetical protein
MAGNFRALVRQHPVQVPSNAVLIFEQVSKNEFALNPLTGNNEPRVEQVRVSGFLRVDRRSQLLSPDASFAEEVQLIGYLLPVNNELASLDISQSCQLELDELSIGGKVRGQFVFQVRVSPFGAEIRQAIGVPIVGVLALPGSGELA